MNPDQLFKPILPRGPSLWSIIKAWLQRKLAPTPSTVRYHGQEVEVDPAIGPLVRERAVHGSPEYSQVWDRSRYGISRIWRRAMSGPAEDPVVPINVDRNSASAQADAL